eukprot:Pgem_evm2s9460
MLLTLKNYLRSNSDLKGSFVKTHRYLYFEKRTKPSLNGNCNIISNNSYKSCVTNNSVHTTKYNSCSNNHNNKYNYITDNIFGDYVEIMTKLPKKNNKRSYENDSPSSASDIENKK